MSLADSVKVVLLGESGVGKTCINNQFIYRKFDPDCISNISAQFVSKTIEYQGYGTIKYDIWDTAGQERYRSMAKIFYKDAKVIIFVYDITNQESFDAIKSYWHEQTKIYCEQDSILAVAANKSDLYEDQAVPEEEGQKFADEIGAIFQTTSAMNNSGIDKLFENIGKKIMDPTYDYKKSDKIAKDKFNQKVQKGKDKNTKGGDRVKLVDDNINNKGKGCCK